MARTCDTCAHPSRAMIDRQLASGAPVRAVSAEFRLSEDSVTRHRRMHLPARLVQREAVRQARAAIDICRVLGTATSSALDVLEEARVLGKAETVLRAVDRLLGCVALQVKISEVADTAELAERLVRLEERLATAGVRPGTAGLLGGPRWPRSGV